MSVKPSGCNASKLRELAARNRISEHDLMEDLRLHGNVDDIADVSLAVFERNGHISVVRRIR